MHFTETTLDINLSQTNILLILVYQILANGMRQPLAVYYNLFIAAMSNCSFGNTGVKRLCTLTYLIARQRV